MKIIKMKTRMLSQKISANVSPEFAKAYVTLLSQKIHFLNRKLEIFAEGEAEENTQAMTEALSTVDTMQITYAARNSDFDGYEIHEGDYLAMYGSSLFGTSQDIKVLLKSLAEKVRDDGREYVTIYYGQDIKEKHAQKAADLFADICPDADVNLINGGQPVYYYLISAE